MLVILLLSVVLVPLALGVVVFPLVMGVRANRAVRRHVALRSAEGAPTRSTRFTTTLSPARRKSTHLSWDR
ncbi:MAG TPA: hypothetical protein VNF05_00540 [Acidimicrobiales bacterium]|nr:hypothetical protein [Acidimicrobiales bacterium]